MTLVVTGVSCGQSEGSIFDAAPDATPGAGSAGAGHDDMGRGGDENDPLAGGAGGAAEGGTPSGGAPGDEGGAPAIPDPPLCVDDNPCTVDVRGAAGCSHEPVKDGTACSDGDFCTLGDRCVGGLCTPLDTATGPAQELGRVSGTGADGVVAVGAGRYLFYDKYDLAPATLTLVELVGESSQILDQLSVRDLNYVDTEHARVAATALGDGLVGLATRSSGGILLFDTSNDELDLVSKVLLPQIWSETLAPASFARSQSRLWTCANGFFSGGSLFLTDLSDPAAPVTTGEVRLGTNCGAVAVSADGERVYVNTSAGVLVVDVSSFESEGTANISAPIAPSSGVSLSGSHLVVRGAQKIEILNEGDLTVAATLSIENYLGATLVGNRLFVQGFRPTGTGAEGYLALYEFTGSELSLLDDVVVEQARAMPTSAQLPYWSARVAADAEHAIHYWTKRLFRVVDDELVEMSIPGLGSLAQVARSGSGNVVLEAHRTQRLDLSGPALRIDLTRNYERERAFEVAPVLYESTTPRKLLFGHPDTTTAALPDQLGIWGPGLAGGGPTVEIRRHSLDADLSLSASGTFAFPRDVSATVVLTDGFLYRLIRGLPSMRLRLERWVRNELPDDGSLLGEPSSVLELDDGGEFELDGGSSSATLDIDEPSGRAAVRIRARPAAGGQVDVLYWLDLSTSPPSVLERTTLTGPSGIPQVSGDRLAITIDQALTFRELGKGEVANFAERPELEGLGVLLEFDGNGVYASSAFYAETALLVIPWGDDSVDVQTFPMVSPPTSFAASPTGLLVGSMNEILSLAPACGN